MQVTVEVGQGLERHVKVEIPYERVEKEVLSHIKKLQPKIKVPGFRQGKVTESVVRRLHGEAIHYDVAGELSRQTAFEAIDKVNLEPLTQPSIEINAIGEGQPLKYTVSFEISPEFELTPMNNMPLEKINSEITKEKLDETLESLRKQQGTWQEVERAAKEGDKVTIDFVGTINDEEFKGGSANGFELELGAGRMIPGFEDKIIGKKKAEKVTIKVPFPADYHAKDLAGKDAKFETTIQKVSESVLPEVNEEFAKKFGVMDGNVETFRQQLKERLEHELNNRLVTLNKDAVLKKMIELNQFEMPQKLLQEEAERLKKQRQQYAKQIGLENMPMDESQIQKQAESRVKLGILVNKYAKLHSLKSDEASVRKLVEEEASSYEEPSQIVKWFYEKPERLSSYIILALENKVVDHVYEHANVQAKHLSCDDVMKMQTSVQ